MLVIPAIDLYRGRCVRLAQGRFEDATVYDGDPVRQARDFADWGARWIHIVDLDAAEGRGRDNRELIGRIRACVQCRIEAGGGVRAEADARALIGLGVDRIVVGTMLARAPAEVAAWVSRLGLRFAAGIDAKDGSVRISGWAEDTAMADTDLAKSLAGLGMRSLVYTNIRRDGTLGGPDIERTNLVARAAGLPTVLSGGIGSPADIDAVCAGADPLVAAVIVGKAFYEGAVDLPSLLERFSLDPEPAW